MRKIVLTAAFVSLMMMTSVISAFAWGPNDPTDKNADPDGDRLGNLLEFRLGTNPLNPDTDGGGCWDGWEHLYGLDPAWPRDDAYDSDNDGWSNYREFLEGTNPMNPNTDNDMYELDSTDPHPLIPDNGIDDDGGVGPVPNPNPDPVPPDVIRPIPGPVVPMPGPGPGPSPNPHPGPIPPPRPDDGDQDHDGLVEFIDSL
jgi:hypothetical protein